MLRRSLSYAKIVQGLACKQKKCTTCTQIMIPGQQAALRCSPLAYYPINSLSSASALMFLRARGRQSVPFCREAALCPYVLLFLISALAVSIRVARETRRPH